MGVDVNRLRQVWDRAADRHMEALEWVTAAVAAPPKAALNADAALSKSPAVKVSSIHRPEPYTVPDGFSSDCLAQVNLSDRMSAVASVPLAFLARWLQLRSEVPVPTAVLSLSTYTYQFDAI